MKQLLIWCAKRASAPPSNKIGGDGNAHAIGMVAPPSSCAPSHALAASRGGCAVIHWCCKAWSADLLTLIPCLARLARIIQEDILKDLLEKAELSNWFKRVGTLTQPLFFVFFPFFLPSTNNLMHVLIGACNNYACFFVICLAMSVPPPDAVIPNFCTKAKLTLSPSLFRKSAVDIDC